MNSNQLRELADIIDTNYYSEEIKDPKNMTEGLSNFVQMAINDMERGDFREALLRLVDLRNDIGSAYVCK